MRAHRFLWIVAVATALAPASALATAAGAAAGRPGAPTGQPAGWAGESSAAQTPAPRQEVLIDGIAAIVNGEVVTLAEVRRAATLLARAGDAAGCGGLADVLRAAPRAGADSPAGAAPTLAAGPPSLGTPAADRERATVAPATPPDGTAADLQARALECLIDQRLVYREVRRFPQLDVTEQEFAAAWQELLDRFGGAEGLAREALRFGSTLEGVRADLRRQLLVARYIDTRFRATTEIDPVQARRFFERELVPDMKTRGLQPPPLEEVLDEYVVPILREREVNRRVESWISDLRARTRIERRLR